MSEDMLAFERMIYEQDCVEGLRINELFDENLAANGPEAALTAAIEQTETEFSAEYHRDLPGVELYGYSAAKNARRWWMYGTAYLEGLEGAAADDLDLKDQAAVYGQEKNYAAEKLLALDPIYFKAFDRLERERVWLHLNSRTDVNPFDMARDYGALVLSGALNTVFDKGAGAKIPDAHARAFTFNGPNAAYVIEKTPDKRAKSYIISESPSAGQPVFGNAKITYIVDGPRDPLGQPFVMRTRGGEPAVVGCTILDLANVVTGYKESLENAAFEHAAAVLAGRREAESQV